MICRETAFLDLTKEENLKKIEISEKLIPSFVSVMQKMQDFFSKKGLIYSNNYAYLFEKYLLTEDVTNKMKIYFATFFNESDMGYFILGERKILINKNVIEPEQLEEVLCHEFIHFLIMTERPYIETANGNFEQKSFRFYKMLPQYGTFLNEAVTEYITKQIYPTSRCYTYQVKMLEFMQSIFGKENNLMEYLRGYIPQDEHELFADFQKYANLFQAESRTEVVSYYNISQNKNYMTAQKILIQMFDGIIKKEIANSEITSVYDYVKRVYAISKKEPVGTNELKKVLQDLNTTFLTSYLNNNNMGTQYKNFYVGKLNSILENYHKIENNIIFEKQIPLNFSYIVLEIREDKIGLVFASGTKYFSRNAIHSNKLISFQSCDKDGKECEVDIFLNILPDKVELKLSNPYNEEYVINCGEKRLNYIKANTKENLKKDIKYLESQKKVVSEFKQDYTKNDEGLSFA